VTGLSAVRFIAVFVAMTSLLPTPRAEASDTVLTLDPQQSRITYSLGAFLHNVEGTFRLTRGVIRSNPSNATATGEIVIDLTSGQSGNAQRDAHMQSDVLQTQLYPQAIFTADHLYGDASGDGPVTVTVTGTLTIHGQPHPLQIPVQIATEKGQRTAHAHFQIPYVAWGMKDPSTFLLHVKPNVDVNVTAVISTNPAN
jgi:polyisoprenoid-binding protein YceI